MTRVDVLIVSLGGTAGLREADEELSGSLRRAGAAVEMCRAQRPAELRTFAAIELAWALNARRAAVAAIREHNPRAVIYSSTTAALLGPVPGAIRFDAPAAGNRPGRHGAVAAPGRGPAASRARRCWCRGARAGWPGGPEAARGSGDRARAGGDVGRARAQGHRRDHLRARTRRRRAWTACSPPGCALRTRPRSSWSRAWTRRPADRGCAARRPRPAGRRCTARRRRAARPMRGR